MGHVVSDQSDHLIYNVPDGEIRAKFKEGVCLRDVSGISEGVISRDACRGSPGKRTRCHGGDRKDKMPGGDSWRFSCAPPRSPDADSVPEPIQCAMSGG